MDLRRIFRRYDRPPAQPKDGNLRGDITSRLRGQVIEALWSNGTVLSIQVAGGGVAHIAWLDDKGEPLKGRPVLVRHGVLLRAEGMRDIISAREAGAPPLKK